MDISIIDTSVPRARQLRDEPQSGRCTNPRISAASTVARTRCRRPDGPEERRARKERAEKGTYNGEVGRIQLSCDGSSHINDRASAATLHHRTKRRRLQRWLDRTTFEAAPEDAPVPHDGNSAPADGCCCTNLSSATCEHHGSPRYVVTEKQRSRPRRVKQIANHSRPTPAPAGSPTSSWAAEQLGSPPQPLRPARALHTKAPKQAQQTSR